MRICTVCKKPKDKECFYKNTGNSTGYAKKCKSCARQYANDRRRIKKRKLR